MYIQRVIYDQSCSFGTTACNSSSDQNSLFDLTKEYVYIVNCEDCINTPNMEVDKSKQESKE